MLEHDPVYTVGVRTSLYAHDQEKLQKTGAQFVKTNRGGLITYHGPGQLTVYPIISLRGAEVLGKGIRWFVSALEQSGFDLCRGILGDRIVKGSILFPESVGATGVWFNKHNKILSIGIRRAGDVIYHGVGLNCTNEPLKWFDNIVPCGLPECKMTSLQSIAGKEFTPAEVAPQFSERLFANLFNPKCDLEFTYSDFLSEDKSLPWEKVVQFVLDDADFRTKKLPRQEYEENR
ncbi:unnamed protein product [Mesocestoides corti]|nr:unnamed protein product [Mesocestoides corti]